MSLEDKIIQLWLLVYDQDPLQAYLFTDKSKVFASVEGLVRSVVPDEMADDIVNMTLSTLDRAWYSSFIPMKFQSTSLFVHRLEIDRHNPIHRTLMKCRDALESGADAQEAIASVEGLLVDPVALGR